MPPTRVTPEPADVGVDDGVVRVGAGAHAVFHE